MAFYVRNIFKILRNSSSISCCNREARLFSSEMSAPSPQRTQDYLMKSVKSAPDCADLLHTVSKHVQVMNHKHLLQVLRKLLDFFKNSRSEISKEEVVKNPTFTAVCQGLKRHVRALDTHETVDALKVLFYLDVPVDSAIYQSLLQILRNNLNYLDIEQVMFLDYIFSKVEGKNHLIDAFKLALPLVFQIHLPIEIDSDDQNQLKRMLFFACKHTVPDKYINNIVTGLLLKDSTLSVNDAISIVRSLCFVNIDAVLFPSRARLMEICLEIIAQNMKQMSYDIVLKTTGLLKTRIVCGHKECYNEMFMDSAAEYCIMKKLPFDKSILIARALSRIAHVNIPLLDYLCELVTIDPTSISQAKTNIIFAMLNCLSNANYFPPPDQWTAIKDSFLKNQVMEAKNISLPWTKVSLELASLGIYDERLLRRIFSDDFLYTYLSRDDALLDYVQLLMLKAACDCFSDYKPFLRKDLFEKAKEFYPVHSDFVSLNHCLSDLFKGHNYWTNVQLPNGIIVDVLICMNEDGSPLHLESQSDSNSKVQFTDLAIPDGARIVNILMFNKGCHSINNQRLRGVFQLLVDVLESIGHCVLPLNLSQWNSMPDQEKIPYLRREIDYKLDVQML